MDKEAGFKWHGIRPVDKGEMEELVREDMRLGGVNMRKPQNLIQSTVLLTDDFDGPSVSVWGVKSSKKFHAKYSAKTAWVAVSVDGDAA